MLNLVSLVIGGIAVLFTAIAFLPLLDWANWLILPVAFIGLGVGIVWRTTAGRNLNLLVIGIGLLRLTIGGGIL